MIDVSEEEPTEEEWTTRRAAFVVMVDRANRVCDEDDTIPPLQFTENDLDVIAMSRTAWVADQVTANDGRHSESAEVLYVVTLMLLEALREAYRDADDAVYEAAVADLKSKMRHGLVISVSHDPDGIDETLLSITFGKGAVERWDEEHDPIVTFGDD